MNAGWKTVNLGEILSVQNGYAFDSKFFGTSGMPLIRIRDIKHGTTTETSYSGGYDEAYVVRSGDYLIGMDGEFRCYMWHGPAALLNQRVCRLTNFSPNVLPAFVCYGINKYLKEIEDVTGYSTVKHLSSKSILSIQFPLPPVAEQKRIVALLDEAFAGIDEAKLNTEASLQGAKSAYESYSDSIFSAQRPDWSVMRLGELCEFLNGFAFKSGDVVQKSQTQLVRMGNLYGNELDLNRSPVFYPNSFAKDYARYVLAEGDVIMSLTGTTGKRDYGFAVRIPSCQHALLLNQRIMKFGSIRQDSVDDTYFLHYLRSRCFLDILYPTAKGTRQANLSSVTMKSLPVPIPPLKEQETISEKISDMRAESIRLSDLLTIKLGKLSELKSSLLAQAFAGELTA